MFKKSQKKSKQKFKKSRTRYYALHSAFWAFLTYPKNLKILNF